MKAVSIRRMFHIIPNQIFVNGISVLISTIVRNTVVVAVVFNSRITYVLLKLSTYIMFVTVFVFIQAALLPPPISTLNCVKKVLQEMDNLQKSAQWLQRSNQLKSKRKILVNLDPKFGMKLKKKVLGETVIKTLSID